MKPFAVTASCPLKGSVVLPGDKSIAHRAVILASLSKGRTVIRNFPLNNDCLATISVFKSLGVDISLNKTTVIVRGDGLFGLKKPRGPLLVKESGTTFRLLAGLLSAQDFDSRLSAGPSLSRRPMSRVLIPLRLMGAGIRGQARKRANAQARTEEFPPIVIEGGRRLEGIRYRMPVASAQVKSAILLAGLYACSPTEIIEPLASRDHTERMLALFGAPVAAGKKRILLKGGALLASPGTIDIPGDISSAVFFMVAASIVPGSKITLRSVSINPCRSHVIGILKKMGARITVARHKRKGRAAEPCADITVRSSVLRPVRVGKSQIPRIIDELPALMVAACFAQGRSVFEGASELRVKETDRMRSMTENLNRMGGRASIYKDAVAGECIAVRGPVHLHGAAVRSFNDHRTAMSMAVAGLAASGRTTIDDAACIAKSFPGFLRELDKLSK